MKEENVQQTHIALKYSSHIAEKRRNTDNGK